MSNDRLDRGAAPHLAADRGGDAAHLAAYPDAELLGVVVAAIAFVDVDAAGVCSRRPLPPRGKPPPTGGGHRGGGAGRRGGAQKAPPLSAFFQSGGGAAC